MKYSQGDIVALKLWNGEQTGLEVELIKPYFDEFDPDIKNCWEVRINNKVLGDDYYKGLHLAKFNKTPQTFICNEDFFSKPIAKAAMASIDVMDYL